MNARERIKDFIVEAKASGMSIECDLVAWNSIDSLTCNAVVIITATGLQNHWPSAQTIVDEARALGYSPEAPRD